MDLKELQGRYPRYKIIYDPKPDCRYCHGKGEVRKGSRGELTSPCICTCVHHDFAEMAQDILNKMAREFREGLKNG